jgi:hypothetical protein
MNKETKAQTGEAKEGALRITRPDDLSFLSRSAMAFIDLPLEGNLFSLIADLLSDLLGNDAILAVSDYDHRFSRPANRHAEITTAGGVS